MSMTTDRTIRVDLSGLKAYVTGGSRGIAAALVRAFATSGADIAFSYAPEADAAAGKPGAAKELAREVEAMGQRAFAIEADMSVPAAGRIAALAAETALGGMDIVVLSASVQVHQPFLAMPPADTERQLRVNLTSNIDALQALLPGMRARRFGRVISIGSVQEAAPSAEMPIYAMTKAALENLVRNLAAENAPHGVTVNNIAPGLVETDRNAFRRQDSEGWQRLARAANPMRRAGQPQDIVGPALFLASHSASFVTGATLYATGGAHIPRPVHDILAGTITPPS
jgi:NAD(P)-dependent dehydrogenase (short-subunit alcohol dehydrogenase family)